MGLILGPRSHVSIATLVRLLLAMTMEIWDPECGPCRPIFAVFAILGQVGSTICPWGKEPSLEPWIVLVPYDQRSLVLKLCIGFSGLAGVMQRTVRATSLNLAFFAVFCTVA